MDSTATQYLYDGEGRICAVESMIAGMPAMTGYLYTAEGQRVAKGMISTWSCDPATNGFTTTNEYVIGSSGEQMSEWGVDPGSSTPAWQHTNVWADGQLFATYDLLGLHYYLNDWLGNRRVQTDSSGIVENICSNLPFGDDLTCTQPTQFPTEHHFTGKERDTESGNDYFGARYYASTTGRFLSPDWSKNPQGVKALGTENDGNNVNVKFGPTGDGSAAQTRPGSDSAGNLNFTITFDPSKNQGMVNQAVNAAHEGTHVADLSDPRFNNPATTLSPFSMEYRGYRTSAYAAAALGQDSWSFKGQNGKGSFPIWNGSWGAVDKNITRYVSGFRDRNGQPDHPETTPHDPWRK